MPFFMTRAHDHPCKFAGEVKNAVLNLANLPPYVRQMIQSHYMFFKHSESALPTSSLSWSFMQIGKKVLPQGNRVA